MERAVPTPGGTAGSVTSDRRFVNSSLFRIYLRKVLTVSLAALSAIFAPSRCFLCSSSSAYIFLVRLLPAEVDGILRSLIFALLELFEEFRFVGQPTLFRPNSFVFEIGLLCHSESGLFVR